MKKNIILEVGRIKEIMGLINEQNEKRMRLPFEKTFKAGYWKISPEVQSQIDSLMGQVKSFVEKYTGNVIKLTVNSGESKITNFDREQDPAVPVEQGYLSDKRYETILNYLKETYPNLLKNLEVEKKLIVGQTPYDKSEFAQNCGNQGEKRDSATCKSFFKKYEPEQFINFTIEVLGKKEPTPETTPTIKSPLCGVKITGNGRQGESENNFISIDKSVNTKNIPGDFNAIATSYSIPDRAQVYAIEGENRKLVMDTGYFGNSSLKRAHVGGLSYYYNKNPDSLAFKSTDLYTMKIETFDSLIDLYRAIYPDRNTQGYERAVRDRGEEGGKRYLREKLDGNWPKDYPKDYSIYRMWYRKKDPVRKYVLFDYVREKEGNFTIDENTSKLQAIVYGPLAKTVCNIQLNC